MNATLAVWTGFAPHPPKYRVGDIVVYDRKSVGGKWAAVIRRVRYIRPNTYGVGIRQWVYDLSVIEFGSDAVPIRIATYVTTATEGRLTFVG